MTLSSAVRKHRCVSSHASGGRKQQPKQTDGRSMIAQLKIKEYSG